MEQLLKNLFKKYNIECSEEKYGQLKKYYEIVVEENKKFNLTAITEKQDFAVKHILDCALPCDILPIGSTVIDIGAGAGFPSIPLKILRPDLKITMIDSLNKRVNFLNNTVELLGLSNIKAIHSRAEDFAMKNRESFDVAIARAVAGLNTLSEYCLPFVKVGGMFVAMKGSNYENELQEAKNAIAILGGKMVKLQTSNIKEIDSVRVNLVIAKEKASPNKYPRGKNLPRLKPLT